MFNIHWRRRSDGRTGMGPRQFEQAEAETLARELNRDYPAIEHQAVSEGATPSFEDDTPTPAPNAADLIRADRQQWDDGEDI